MEDSMAQQTFSVGMSPRVNITRVNGDLSVRTWKEQAISVEIDGDVDGIQQEGDLLTIIDCDSDIELVVPEDTAIKSANITGDVQIVGVRRVELENVAGDATIKNISGDAGLENIGEAVDLTNLGGDLSVTNTPILRVRHSVGGDASLKDVGVIEIEIVGSDLAVERAETVMISTVGGDLSAEEVTSTLRCGVIGGDAEIKGGARSSITIGNTGGDLSISSAANVQTGNVGGDCSLRDVQGDVELGYIGGDVSCNGIGGNLQVGRIGSDAALKGLQASTEVGSIGGDLVLQAAFPVESSTRLNVGGDAVVVLLDNPNLTIQANVGGDISGRSIIASRSGKMISLNYGDGAAHLELNVGGDLALRGAGSPRSSSSASASWGWEDFGREMSSFGREMSKLGQELSREIAEAFNEAGWSKGADMADSIARKADEQARRAQRKAGEQARRANEQASRINVRFNDREWRLDPERLDKIREQARKAASEGIAGALEAVERAVGNLGIPKKPTPPKPPTPPQPPFGVPPVPANAPAPPTAGFQQGTDAGEQVNQASRSASSGDADASAPGEKEYNLDQEREAILRMIAEGRITPEEGDLLLEALGS
jgi:hypothetical protein